jgi:hypothetical protein
MDCYIGPQTVLTIDLHGGIYLSILMASYGGSHTALIIALHGRF